ncbi:MAG: twin-arginine translocase subunit TatC [Actinomycetota bacterium]|nr:twin-arginine translocase subunit TatC [Actinomycetota bacterium]
MNFKRSKKKSTTDGQMTLFEHIAELRGRLVKIVLAIAVGSIVAYLVYNPILSFFTRPYCQISPGGHCQLYVTGPIDGFSLRIKVAGYGGVFLALPVILWQLWRFITPGLKDKEKRYALPFVFSSLLLFVAGAYVAYITFPHALAFLQSAGGSQLRQIYTPSSYLSLIFLLMAAFGASFEFPVLLVALQLVKVVTPKKLASWRRWAIVTIVTVAAVVIPSSDPFSLFALAIPLILFYEIAILVGRILLRDKSISKGRRRRRDAVSSAQS